MNRTQKITLAASAFVVAGLVAIAVPAISSFVTPPEPTPNVNMLPVTGSEPEVAASGTGTEPENPEFAVPKERPITELPEWAKENLLWLIYPDDLRCWGTEGCPNDFRAAFGEPSDVLPEGVEYYDPAVHNWDTGTDKAIVRPADS